MVVSDNGTELTSHAILRWQQERVVGWHYIARAGRSRTLLSRASMAAFAMSAATEHVFRGLPMARRMIEAWRRDYNLCRPHPSLGGLAPNEFAARSQPDHNRMDVGYE
jgi:putative transposase